MKKRLIIGLNQKMMAELILFKCPVSMAGKRATSNKLIRMKLL